MPVVEDAKRHLGARTLALRSHESCL